MIRFERRAALLERREAAERLGVAYKKQRKRREPKISLPCLVGPCRWKTRMLAPKKAEEALEAHLHKEHGERRTEARPERSRTRMRGNEHRN